MHVCLLSMFLRMYVCIYVYMYVCIYIYICMYVSMFIYFVYVGLQSVCKHVCTVCTYE